MAEHVCVNCSTLCTRCGAEPCCEAPSYVATNDMPSEIKRLRAENEAMRFALERGDAVRAGTDD